MSVIILKILNKLYSILINHAYTSMVMKGKGVKFGITSKVINPSRDKNRIVIGEDSLIAGQLITDFNEGSIKIGAHSYVGEGSKIYALENIHIGDRVLISHNVNIYDNNSHPVNSAERAVQAKSQLRAMPTDNGQVIKSRVIIEDDVWIGMNSIILKGVTIGKGSVVGAGSLVTKSIPPHSMVTGPTADKIRDLGPANS
jgi:acetyltransferase-like isoleucine patch superfamily enzyme